MTAPNEAASYVRLRPNRQSEDVNSLGFHSPELLPEKSERQRRIGFLGGSTTYNPGPVDETYAHFVCSYLKQKGLQVDYVNAGCVGYSSTESLIIYHLRVRALKPDLVVFYNGRNDLILSGNSLYSPIDLTDMWHPYYYRPPSLLHQYMSRLSNLYALSMEFFGYWSYRRNNWDRLARIDKGFAEKRGTPKTFDEFIDNINTKRVLEVYRPNVEALAVLTGHSGTNLLLVGFAFSPKKLHNPVIRSGRQITEVSEFMGQMIKTLNTILKETAEKFPHVYFLDLDGKIDREYFLDDCHLNGPGKWQKGQIIGKFILDHKEKLGW